MLKSIPLLLIPLVVFNALVVTATALDSILFAIPMMSGETWRFTVSDSLVSGALVLLFVEIIKATRTSGASLVDHGLSFVVFVLFLVQFLLFGLAANSTFFTLMLISLIDVVGGYSITITAARRDVALDSMPHGH